MARRYDSKDSKRRILSACVKFFIERGYKNTKMADIIREADVSASTFQNIFRTKDGVLMELVEFMFENQFDMANKMVEKLPSPAYLYAMETSIQLALAEINENMRDVYVEAYTFSQTADYIHEHMSSELYGMFGAYMQDCSESDFYELEIGSSGIMRAYMARPCDKYFTLEKKLERFLEMSLSVYKVPDDEQKQIIDCILKIDIRQTAYEVMQHLFTALAMKFNFELTV